MFNFFKITPKKRSVKIGKKYGILYSNPSKPKKFVFYLASILIFLSISYLVYLYEPLIKSLIRYKFTFGKSNEINESMEDIKIVDNDFYILIPKIAAKSNIIANVSPYNKEEYLKVLANDEVAQSKTSSLPGFGKDNTTYLFAHSTQQSLNMVRKNSVFYLLGKLETDDLIYVKYKGDFFRYRVYDKKVISYKEADYLNYKDKDKEVLILQTCWPIGTNWKRLLVFAERV